MKKHSGADPHSRGNPDARVTLTEFADYQCAYCGPANIVVKALQKALGADLRFVFRNFPLREIHPNAMGAATFAETAAAQGAFWPFHDVLFEHQDDLSEKAKIGYARARGLDVTRLTADVSSAPVQARIDRDMLDGEQSGIQGTPSFLINGERYDGDASFANLREAIERAGGVAPESASHHPARG